MFQTHYNSQSEAIAAVVSTNNHDALLAIRHVGPWGSDLKSIELPPVETRKLKKDTLLVFSGGTIVGEFQISTWPFHDKNPPTKLLMPGHYPAFWAKGIHNGRPGLVQQGLSKAHLWVYHLNGKPMNEQDSGWRGINLHTDLGNSEACITLNGQEKISKIYSLLNQGSNTHPDGRQLFDLYLTHVP